MASFSPSSSTYLEHPDTRTLIPIRAPTTNTNPHRLQFAGKTQSLEGRCSHLLQSSSSFTHLRQIHAYIIRHSFQQNHFLAARLVSSSFSLGHHSYALRFFNLLLAPDAFLFNAMIKGFVSAGRHREALQMYCAMFDVGFFPNEFTLPLALKACTNLAAAEEGKVLHGHVLKLGHGLHVFTQTALLDLYGSCSDLISAWKLFDRMAERDVVAWNTMLSACVRSGSISLAEDLFDQMPAKNVKSWTVMISGLMYTGDPKRALTTFRQMQLHGVKPDKMVIAAILSAISHLGYLRSGEWVHEYATKSAIPIDAFVGTALIDMYSKSGSIQDARSVFCTMRDKNTSCYNAMIFGLAVHGLGEEALRVFEEMRKKMEIDDVTMIAILTACSHSGLVEEGLRCFKMMREVYGIDPNIKHYGCAVDLLARAGRFAEAVEIVDSIEVDCVVLGSLAAACRKHGNEELADELAMRMSCLDPRKSGFLVWRADLHAAKDEWEEAAKIRSLMKEQGIEKSAGCSWIEVGERVHLFVAGDCSHPSSSEIYYKLDELYNAIKPLGMEGQVG